MATFNAEFWEVPTESRILECVPTDKGLWYETEEDRTFRHARQDFFQDVRPIVIDLIDNELTPRQQEVLKLYYFLGKTQEDIAEILALSQSTVSRHLFGTVRNGRRVGGAVPKLQKLIRKLDCSQLAVAIQRFEQQASSS